MVSTMLVSDQRNDGRPFRDGYISNRGTFQKYYSQYELQSFIDSVLDESPIPLGPGVFIIFKNKEAEASFLGSRVRSQSRATLRFTIERSEATHERQSRRSIRELLPRQKELLDALWSQMLDLGRSPLEAEVQDFSELREQFGSLKSALKALSKKFDQNKLRESAAQRRNEILVILAIHHFRKAARIVTLDDRLKNDILALFGSVRIAQQSAMELVAGLRQSEQFESAILWSLERGIGALVEDKGLFVHRGLITRLPPQLQIAIWAASLLSDGLEACDLVRIHDGLEHISFYRYDNFDEDPLPALRHQCKINIRRQRAHDRYVSSHENVRLIGKSRFLNEESHLFQQADDFDRELILIGEFEPEQLHIRRCLLTFPSAH